MTTFAPVPRPNTFESLGFILKSEQLAPGAWIVLTYRGFHAMYFSEERLRALPKRLLGRCAPGRRHDGWFVGGDWFIDVAEFFDIPHRFTDETGED